MERRGLAFATAAGLAGVILFGGRRARRSPPAEPQTPARERIGWSMPASAAMPGPAAQPSSTTAVGSVIPSSAATESWVALGPSLAGSNPPVLAADPNEQPPAPHEPDAIPPVALEAQPRFAEPPHPVRGPAAGEPRVEGRSWSGTATAGEAPEPAVIRDSQTWASIWTRLGRRDGLPQVDFGREMAIVVTAGGQPPGARLEIVSVAEGRRRLLVHYRVLPAQPPPAGGSRGASESPPYEIVVTRASSLKPRFIDVAPDLGSNLLSL